MNPNPDDLLKRIIFLENKLEELESLVQRKLLLSVEELEFISNLHKNFSLLAGSDLLMDKSELKKVLGLKDDMLADRIFNIIDKDKSGSIDKDEFISSIEKIIYGTDDDKLKFLFSLNDLNGDGLIDLEELSLLLQTSLNENQLYFSNEQIYELSSLLFNQTDTDNSGSITFDEFKNLMTSHPRIMGQCTLNSISFFKPPVNKDFFQRNLKEKVSLYIIKKKKYVLNNYLKICFFSIYLLINLVVGLSAFLHYREIGANVYVQIARFCGACLNLNAAIILIPMLRHFLTWLKRKPISRFLLLDDMNFFHKLIGQVLFSLALVHTFAHLLNYSILPNPITYYLFSTKAGLTGFLMLIVFIIMWVFALSIFRKKKHFSLFYISHFGFVLWFAFGLFHGPVLWKWVAVPLIAYILEWSYRAINKKVAQDVLKVNLLPSGVSNLIFGRPKNFKYNPSDYVFLKIPMISKYEWHPFTLTSVPEEDTLSVHIRSAGSWSNALYQYYKSNSNLENKKILIDGPYGTPSMDIFDSECAILIGTGIGITPFAAILKSIYYKHKESKLKDVKLKKVYFFWLNRTQKSFEWFNELLSEIEQKDEDKFIESHIYMTSGHSDIWSNMLNVAMDLLFDKNKVDLITGLGSQTQMGRPNWNEIFKKIKEKEDKKVDVYFCGSPMLADDLKRTSQKYGFSFRKETF